MKKTNKKLIALSVMSSILLSAGMAFAQPQPTPVPVPMNGNSYGAPISTQPQPIAKKPVKHQRYVFVRKKNGHTVKVDCWKRQNKQLRVCRVR